MNTKAILICVIMTVVFQISIASNEYSIPETVKSLSTVVDAEKQKQEGLHEFWSAWMDLTANGDIESLKILFDKCPAVANDAKDSDIFNMSINIVSSLVYLSSTTQDTTIYSYFEKYLFDENFSERSKITIVRSLYSLELGAIYPEIMYKSIHRLYLSDRLSERLMMSAINSAWKRDFTTLSTKDHRKLYQDELLFFVRDTRLSSNIRTSALKKLTWSDRVDKEYKESILTLLTNSGTEFVNMNYLRDYKILYPERSDQTVCEDAGIILDLLYKDLSNFSRTDYSKLLNEVKSSFNICKSNESTMDEKKAALEKYKTALEKIADSNEPPLQIRGLIDCWADSTIVDSKFTYGMLGVTLHALIPRPIPLYDDYRLEYLESCILNRNFYPKARESILTELSKKEVTGNRPDYFYNLVYRLLQDNELSDKIKATALSLLSGNDYADCTFPESPNPGFEKLLLALVNDKNKLLELREAALKYLVLLDKDEKKYKELSLTFLQDEYSELSKAAIQNLSIYKEPDLVDMLIDDLFSELKVKKYDYAGINSAIDWHRRSTSLDNIASTGTDNSVLFFENLLNHEPSEKTSLIRYLGKTRNSKAVRVLEKLYYDDKTENSIKYIILTELSRMKREDANEIVIRLYSDYLKTNLPRLDSYGYDMIMNNIRGIANAFFSS